MITNMRLPKKQNIQETNPEDPLKYHFMPFIGRFYIKRLQIALEYLVSETKQYDKILEVGYGSGIFFPELVRHCKKLQGLEVFGLKEQNIVRKMMLKENICVDLIQGSILDIPFPGDYFDALICISTIEHLEPKDIDQALSEIKRVVKKDGTIIIGFPSMRKSMQLYAMMMMKTLNFDHHKSNHKLILKKINDNMKVATMTKFFRFLPIYYIVKCIK